MSRVTKILLLELWFVVWCFILMGVAFALFNSPEGGTAKYLICFLAIFLFAFWFWQLFAYFHYRYCRQEEFLHVLQTAATAKAPIESVLRAYLKDRPRGDAYQSWLFCLLFFVFPGYFFIHQQLSYDTRLHRLASMLQTGAPLSQALRLIPGLVPREIALAVAVGRASGNLSQALQRIPDRRLALQWLEAGPRFAYPLLILMFLASGLSFLMVFIVPKYEKIFLEFKMKLPLSSEILISMSRWFGAYGYVLVVIALLLLGLFNLLLFNSHVTWYFPSVGWLYRLHTRGQFLQVLGHLLETNKPLPEILEVVTQGDLLPDAIKVRARDLAVDVAQGKPLAESLLKNGLATNSAIGLIASAEKAKNLPWVLQEIGASMTRSTARWTYRLTMVFFPLGILIAAMLIGFVAIAMFTPLVSLLEGMARDV